MNLDEWRKSRAEGEPFTLPSGLEVKLRRVQTLDLAKHGEIPTPLFGLVNDMFAEGEQILTLEQYGKNKPVVELVVRACVVSPAGLDIGELTAADVMAVWNWANDILVEVRPFRQEPVEPVANGRARAKVRDKAE